jgi:glutathione synthase/RimK-type ligase-like ATP-grasp enzyme
LFATTTGIRSCLDEAASVLGVEPSWRQTGAINSTTRGATGHTACPTSRRWLSKASRFAEVTPSTGAGGGDARRRAAAVAEALGIPWHSHASAEASRNKLRTRQRLRQAGLRGPDFGVIARSTTRRVGVADHRVVKQYLSGSRGVIRADTPAALARPTRVSRLLAQTDIRALRDPDASVVLVETFIPGRGCRGRAARTGA